MLLPLLNALIPLTYLAFMAVESIWPARSFPPVKGWRLKGLAFFLGTGLVMTTLGQGTAAWSRGHHLFSIAGLGTVASAIVAFVVTDFLGYWIHRAEHRVGFLWRWMHQLHHSAERVDMAGMSYSHPLEIARTAILTTLTGTVLLGIDAEAAAIAGYLSLFVSCFQHANIRTPRWIGFVVQRPESHAVHHERAVHAHNYAGIALIDMMFGTLRNPLRWQGAAGFWDGASGRVLPMLLGRDIAVHQRPRDATLPA